MKYPGGKGASGTYQHIINQIPPHEVYIETHLGGGAILRHKRRAAINIGIDVDPLVIREWQGLKDVNIVHGDAYDFLVTNTFTGDEFIYIDPPYLKSTRKTRRDIYHFEYSESDHIKLLTLINNLPCNIMISGYWSDLYDQYLSTWRTYSYQVRDQSGSFVTEWLWMNYDEPTKLHDYQYLGQDFREREKIRRKLSRWKERIEQLPELERQAFFSVFNKQ